MKGIHFANHFLFQNVPLAVTSVATLDPANVTSAAASRDIPSTKPLKSAKVRRFIASKQLLEHISCFG